MENSYRIGKATLTGLITPLVPRLRTDPENWRDARDSMDSRAKKRGNCLIDEQPTFRPAFVEQAECRMVF
jgi:hypothetical protein